MALDYDILVATAPDDLAVMLREKAREGWIPQGGVSVAIDPTGESACPAFAIAIARFATGGTRNQWEKARKEFLKGCSCAEVNQQETCSECLEAFCNHLRSMADEEVAR